VYLQARWWHPTFGRFLERATFAGYPSRPQSVNRHAYTENNPVRFTGLSGHGVGQEVNGACQHLHADK
jgi:RHS repeat-associated protein